MSHAKKKRKRSRKKRATKHSPIPRAPESGAPRPRRKLPDAMRAAGVDEERIALSFAEQLDRLEGRKKTKGRIPGKLLLDYLKECVRIVYAPARRGVESEQPTTVELVHFVPRPERNEQKPPVTPDTGS
ncbi:MAG TPA: hypothetical protein VGT03_06910 [Candidatus Acidoferrales bacterium]|nr:hypothetical protein [Candidatus Acidoferrales bacterium]